MSEREREKKSFFPPALRVITYRSTWIFSIIHREEKKKRKILHSFIGVSRIEEREKGKKSYRILSKTFRLSFFDFYTSTLLTFSSWNISSVEEKKVFLFSIFIVFNFQDENIKALCWGITTFIPSHSVHFHAYKKDL